MDRRRAAGALLALAACIACSAAAPTANDHTALDMYDGTSEGCYYNFQHYGEGDRIMTNEPCLNCTCHNKMLMCYLRVCPFTKPIGQDCTVEKRADQCCPIVTCPDVPVDLLTSTSTTSPAEYGATGIGKLDKYGCSIHGKYFSEGSKVPPTPNKPCEHCYCIRNMTTCVMQECTLHVDGCTPIYHKEVCCPVRYSCDHPEDEILLLDDMTTTVRPTPGFLLTTTTLSPVTQMTQDCVHDDRVFPDGALIKTEKACEHCYCMKGDIVCVVQECGTPMENEGKNCSSLPPREGQCCPDTYICEGDELSTEPSTEEMLQEQLTTLSPPRRVGVEGSGYRNEPGEAAQTESSVTDIEIEGSGEEQSNTVQEVDTTGLFGPETSTPALTDEYLATTEKEQQYIPITTKSPKLDENVEGTESPEPSQGINIIPEEVPNEVSTVPDQYVSSTTVVPTQQKEHIPLTTSVSVQDVEISTKKTLDGQDLTSVTISEKESSDLDQFIPITTSTPIEDIGGEDTTEPTETQPSITSESSEQEPIIPTTAKAPTVEESKEPSIEPIEDQDVKPGDTTEVETEEPEEYSSITTSKPKLEESETPSIDPGVSDPEAVTESKLPELDEGEIYTTETSEGHDEASGTINEKDSSEPELISVTTTTPVLHEIEKESTLPNIVSEAITENDGSDFDQFIPITTSLPALDEKDQLSTKLNSEITTDFVETTDRFVPEKYYTTISSLVDEKDESTTIVPINQDITQTATSNKESSEPDEFIKRTTVTSLLEEEHLSTIIPIEDEFTKPQPTTTPAYDKDEETSVGLDKQQDSDSGITSKDQTSGLEEPKSTEPTTDKKQVTGTETTTIVADVSSVSKEEPFTITTEASLRKEDSIAPTDSQKQLETTSVNIESITESINLETKSPISSSPEDHPITKEDEIKETIESTTTAVIKEDKKEPLSESEGEIAITTTAIDKMQLPETTTINIGDNEIDEDSVITSGRIPGEGDCLLNGITYRNESVVPSSNNCHIGCRCISSIIKCEPVICSPPPEYMNNCQPTYDSSESCCPTYVCDHSKETIPPESQSQMSGTESPVPSPTTFECRGDQCEVSEEKVQSCASGDCSKEPSVEPECSSENCSPIQAPTHPESAEHPEKCEAGKCEPSKETCANGECQHPPIVEQALPVKPCESDNCEEKSDESVIPQIPVVSCGGESGLGDCSLDATSPPQNVEKDVTCADENGCQKPQEESKLECVGESCRRKESADIDGKLPSPCTGSECAQQTPTQNSLEMDIPTSKSPEPVVDTLDTTLKPLVTKDQEAQTEVPTSDTTETVTTTSKISEQITTESQDHASSDTEGLITKTTKDSSFNDITTLLPETISESIEIESPDEESHKKVTTGIPQTEDIHLETTGTVPLEDSTKQDVPIISDLETELTTKISVSENQDVYTEKPLPTTETPFSSTEKSHDVSDIVESEKDMIVTQLPEETVDLNESSTVSSDKQEMEPGTDQVVEYTEKPGEKLETSDCSSEDCSNKETQTLPQSVEHTKECVDGKCEPSEANCVNGKCDLLPIEGSKLTESPINQQTSEITEDHIENDKTTISPVVSEIMGSHTDSSELTDSTVIPQTIEEFTEKVHETPETQTTQVVDSTDTQELVTKKPEEQEVSQTESPHSYVTEPFKETKSPDFNDQPSYDITKTPEMPVTELEKETKLPISELDEVSTKLSEIDTIKELTTEQYDNTQQSIDDSSQDVGEAPSKTVPEIIPTLSNEVVTESSDIPYIPDVETDIDSTLKLDQTTKASLLTVTTGIDEVKTTHIILEEENTETPSVYTTKAEELFTNENVQSITEQTQTISQVTGRPSAVTADLEQQEIITEKIKISAEPEEPVTDGIVTYPESHDIEPQKNTPSIVSPQKEIGTLETLVPSDKFTEEKVTTESMIPISTEKEITEPINVTEMNIAVDQTDLPHHGIITQLPEAMMTEEPETTDNPETDISKDEILKTESPEQHDGLEKITTAATTEPLIDNEIKHEYPAQTSQTVKEEHSTEVPIHYATEPQKSHTDSLEPDVTEAEHNELQTETSKPSILDDTTKTGQHVESPDESPQSPVEHDENTEVPAISPEQPVPSQSTEFSTTAPQEESTGDEYVTPKESATVKYQEDLITDKTPQIATEPSEPYIPVHHEYSSTETPQESVTDLPHKVSEQDDVSVTEQYDITTISDELVKESHTETSKVDVTEPQELITETPDVAVKEDIITEKPTEHFEITDEKLDITTAIPKLPTTEIQDTESTEDIYTKTPLSLVTEAPKDTTKKIEDAADHKTTESVETPNAFEGLSTEVPAITSPQEYVTKSHDVVTKSPEITDIEVNEIKTETIPLMEIETSTKSVELPVTETEIFTTEPQSHEGETKTPESMVTESQDLGSTEKPKESTTLAEEIYTEQPSKLPVSGSEATDTDLSSVTVEDELPKLSTESPVPLVTDGQQITTEKSETQEIFTDPQSTSTGTPIKSEPEEQEQHSESYLTVTTASGEAITEKTDLVKEPETVTTISDHLTTEKTDILHPESYDTQVPIEISSKLPLPYEDIITNKPDETEVTSVPKFETSESTPYLIELEEHTHKLEEELSTTGIPDEQLITSKVEVQQEQNESEITTKKSIVEDSTASEADEIPIKKDETIPTVTSLLPSDEVYVKTTESSVSTEEITSLPITSELPATPDVVKTYETEAVVTVPSTSAPIPIEKETTTHTVSMDIEGSPIQDLTPTEQTEEDKTISEKPHKPDVPSVTTPPEEVLISTTIKATTPKFEDATTQTPAPIDKHPITEEKPSEIMPSTTAPELSKPGSNEIQPTDEVPSPDDGGHLAPSGTSGYGPEPDYFEEDQTFGPGTCRYGGKVYVSAQQIPRDDPCDFCFCFRSDIICLQQSCPPPIHGCHEEPIQGFCCPRYECPVSMATTLNVTTTTTTTTTTLPPHFPTHPYKGAAQRKGCQIKGHTYKVGEVVRASSGPCLHCTCGGDGQMKCDPKACTPEPMLRQMIAAAVSAKRRR